MNISHTQQTRHEIIYANIHRQHEKINTEVSSGL